MAQPLDDGKLNKKIAEAKQVYSQAMVKLDALKKAQKRILETERKRVEEEWINKIRRIISGGN